MGLLEQETWASALPCSSPSLLFYPQKHCSLNLHAYIHASFLSVVSPLGFCCYLCYRGSMSPGHPLRPLLLSTFSTFFYFVKGCKSTAARLLGLRTSCVPHHVQGFVLFWARLCSVPVCAMELLHVPAGLQAGCSLLLAGEGIWRQVPLEPGSAA